MLYYYNEIDAWSECRGSHSQVLPYPVVKVLDGPLFPAWHQYGTLQGFSGDNASPQLLVSHPFMDSAELYIEFSMVARQQEKC